MNKVLAKISPRTARVLVAIFYGASISVHVLIIFKVIPYLWVNGGMSKSYEAQLTQSVVSALIISAIFLYVWMISAPKRQVKTWQKRVLYVVTALWVLGFFQQLLGTPFERYFMSVVLVTGVISHLVLVRRLRHVRQDA